MIKTENLVRKEQIIKEVTPIGNGAHIFAPKDWIGEEVVVTRILQPSLKDRILHVFQPYLEYVKGIYLYGSHARKEAEKDSDIDILAIVTKKLTIKEKGFEIIVLEEESIPQALKISSILIYSALAEAKTIINAELLEKLRADYKPDKAYFRLYLRETENILEINKDILDSYSLILRLRGIYIIHQLLEKSIYSHKNFKLWIRSHLPSIELDSLFLSYKRIKNNKKPVFIKREDLKQIFSFLESETHSLNNKLYGKKKKEA